MQHKAVKVRDLEYVRQKLVANYIKAEPAAIAPRPTTVPELK